MTTDERPQTLSELRRRASTGWTRLLRVATSYAPTENQRLFAVTLTIGMVCGLAAVAFHLAIRFLERHGVGQAEALPGPAAIAWLVSLPTLGGLICGVLLQYVVPAARGSGIPQVKIAYASPGGELRLRDAVGKFVISALQIGSGASLGREGPTVHICAGIASRLGRLAGVSPASLRRLLPVGAAAGIAAAFNAPIAAVTFTIEEVVGTLDQTVLSGVVIAAALAAVIERTVLGANPIFDVPPGYSLQSPKSLVLYAAMGIVGAGVSVAFTDLLLAIRARFKGLAAMPPWMRPATGGLVTGVLAAFALALLHAGGVTGGGYETLSQALTGRLPLLVMLALMTAKLVATAFAYGTGGAGGIFAPSLFMGGMLGGAAGSLDIALFDHTPQSHGAFALVGMGAVFAGVIRAPITSVLIIIEMTDGYGLILPLMIANMTSFVLARRLRPTPIYEALLEQDGFFLGHHGSVDALDRVHLDASMLREAGTALTATTRGVDLLRRLEDLPLGQSVYPVLEDDRTFLGMVTAEDLAILAEERELGDLVVASDLMRRDLSLNIDDSLRKAFDRMRSTGVGELAVVDGAGQFLGLIDEATVAREYLRRSASGKSPSGGPARRPTPTGSRSPS